MPMRRRLLAALLTALPLFAWAAWPERPITIVVPAAAGGTTDIAARVLAEKMGKDLGTAIRWRAPSPTATRCSWATSAPSPSTSASTSS